MPIFDWTRKSPLLSDPAIEDIILNCRRPDQDAEFAAKYHVTKSCIANYRLIRAGRRIWQRLLEEGRLPHTEDGDG